MPTFTFVASFESILAAGAKPVLVDIDDTLTLDPAAVEKAITPRTKAVMPVHMCGSMADLDALKDICERHGIYLLEDACQAFGATYKGKKVGTIGDAGTFSFDFVKTITCGEGGAMITNNDDFALWADQYTDHGHDHVGTDRGAETHPIIGYNFRISELHAAVGLGQIKRMDEFLSIQRRNHGILKQALSGIPEVSFRRIPDPEGDSCGFLNFFMSSSELTQKVVKAFKASGIDGFWNYYENNWHYVRRWEHLKEAKSLFPLAPEVQESLKRISEQKFPQSDDLISRNISCLIKLSWSEEQVKQLGEKMAAAIRSVL